ncbi:lipoprotein-releasing ABC transporter permease subunit [Stenotrophomonas maltophilia]|jgi:lipoprotein-releasing system permease protein|uniref:Cell division protein FtsX n=1 Tax=Stenotrophomonas maltophilia TaxID=40324 RepID=A0AAP7GV68_STEMA|nr:MULTISPECIES: lipoprotein-releasing ABC transporter permease subunit [Stenotrophomonas]MBA0222544.1 lipoprotein-releasing ABC transporter permease subunit [Stenotrophomonas maltophilia]MBE5268639.1 lipoprotein-releasing ABC transporter permease subunit [Stenotrophomonas sp. B2]MBH1666594.1 lipoprotein-releasing ABC transporter permease subunit [Stenotrophomonas maltophilia]MBN4936553.1 lipoprotein-releasing ABC transporter permease subunit [Stenotrophomonas maltophilia]MCO7398595.1 lipoprot
MFKPIPVAIGLRYLRAKRRNGFISFISMASILGIALGVTVLITTLAVMSGFQKEIRSRLLQMTAHTTISRDGEPMPDWMRVVDVANKDPRVAGAAPYIEIQSMISGPRVQGAIIQGIDPALEPKVSVIDQKVVKGSYDSLKPGSFNLLLGKELAIWLGVDVGDQVLVTFAEVQGTPAGAVPRMKRFTVSGIFEAGYNEVDRGVGFANMKDLERVLRADGATGVRLKLHDMDRSLEVGVDLAQNLGGAYRVSDWTQQNANLYHSLRMEKVVMGILLSLIIAMGAFNLVSSQVMLVTDKQADIAILRTLGLTPAGVMQVFMVQGSLIGIFGTLAGLIGGITLTFNLERILGAIERVFNVKLLPEDVYYITGLPTDMQTGDVVVITVVALLMSFLATLYPAWRAARTQPAEALRYE